MKNFPRICAWLTILPSWLTKARKKTINMNACPLRLFWLWDNGERKYSVSTLFDAAFDRTKYKHLRLNHLAPSGEIGVEYNNIVFGSFNWLLKMLHDSRCNKAISNYFIAAFQQSIMTVTTQLTGVDGNSVCETRIYKRKANYRQCDSSQVPYEDTDNGSSCSQNVIIQSIMTSNAMNEIVTKFNTMIAAKQFDYTIMDLCCWDCRGTVFEQKIDRRHDKDVTLLCPKQRALNCEKIRHWV